nr:hypothetical protein 3a - Trypanosoma brucei mitochondrion [Trypanosoma brucei]
KNKYFDIIKVKEEFWAEEKETGEEMKEKGFERGVFWGEEKEFWIWTICLSYGREARRRKVGEFWGDSWGEAGGRRRFWKHPFLGG